MATPHEHPIDLAGPAGRLEALQFLPAEPAAGGVLLLHPHPLHGGNLHSKVIFTSQHVCAELGLATQRFNFRGVGASAGHHDGTRGAQADAQAALAALAAALPDAPLFVLGFSFGAWIALRMGCAEEQVRAIVALGTPVDWGGQAFLAACAKPKLFIHGSEDQYCDPAALAQRFPGFARPAQLEWIEGADHFFTGRLPALASALRAHFPPQR